MDTLQAYAMAQAHKGNHFKVFDWDKAARLIRERGAQRAGAGLSGDWEWTGGQILKDGKPIPREDTYTFLASNWAMPELVTDDGDVEDCFIIDDEARKRWGDVDLSSIYWPPSALAILNGNA